MPNRARVIGSLSALGAATLLPAKGTQLSCYVPALSAALITAA